MVSNLRGAFRAKYVKVVSLFANSLVIQQPLGRLELDPCFYFMAVFSIYFSIYAYLALVGAFVKSFDIVHHLLQYVSYSNFESSSLVDSNDFQRAKNFI